MLVDGRDGCRLMGGEVSAFLMMGGIHYQKAPTKDSLSVIMNKDSLYIFIFPH